MMPVEIDRLTGSSLVPKRDRKSMNSLFQIFNFNLCGTEDARGMPSLTMFVEKLCISVDLAGSPAKTLSRRSPKAGFSLDRLFGAGMFS